jgi:hypothetical protein
MAKRSLWEPYDDVRGWLRGAAISLAAAAFLTISGAFTTGHGDPVVVFVYWVVLLLGGYVLGASMSRVVLNARWAPEPLWQRTLLVAVLLSVPYTVVVGFASQFAFQARFELADFPVLLLSVFVVTLAVTAINVLVETRRIAVTNASPAPPKFLERLPLKLRGAEVWAVEAEDHYLRLHTSRGQDLILLRLADAVAELEGIEGLQVHRSWWVARDAITDAKRGDGRATLTLKDGAEVPVSRTYAGLLREKGWI